MKKLLKILAFTAGAIILVLFLAGLALAFLVPWDKVKDKLIAESSAMLNREVKIEKLEFSLFKGCLLYTSPSPRD